ncbi:MAG TPA: FCD domain-containing protein [Usitatibacter sp.]|jgi:DNA-binding GntR family transcriptional regulator|nr:FCD domain-containing protein [Usitatibacter sp.]
MTEVVNTRAQSQVPAVQRELERMIAVGELKGGDRINESALAMKLGISRGPIREACRTLEQTGLLRSEINRGFFVRQISMKEALDIYDLRAQLSLMAGRLAAGSITSAALAELDGLVERMEAAAIAGDVGAYYPLNVDFHTALIDCADNHKLAQLWPTLESELHLFRTRSFILPGSLRASNHDHRSVVEALRSGDAERAGRLLEEHILKGKARLLKTVAVASHLGR